MSDWANAQIVAIARRVIVEPGASQPRREWAAAVLVGVDLTAQECAEVKQVLQSTESLPERTAEGA